MKPKFRFPTFILLTLAILASCDIRGSTPMPLVTQDASSTPTPIRLVTLTPSSEPTPMNTPVLTLTPLPTLISEDAHTALTNLIQGEENCVLPCWFGIIPGQTDFTNAGNILSQFSAIAITEFSSRWAYIKVIYPTYYMTTLVYPTKDQRADHILVDTSLAPDANGKLSYADPAFRAMWQKYFLPELFTGYGAPEKVFLDTTRVAADPTSTYPYVLWVVYDQQGFFVRYEGENVKVGDNIRICPLQSKITIELWDSETSSYEQYIEGEMAMGTSLGPQPIEAVTDFNTESFYEMFKEAKFDTCFETPASVWPH